MRSPTLIIASVILLVIGLAFGVLVLNQTSNAGADPSLGSFAGASALLDLVPLVYMSLIVLITAAMMSAGLGIGPFKR